MSDSLRTSLPSAHAAASPLPKKRPQTGPSRPARNTGNTQTVTETGTAGMPATRPATRPGTAGQNDPRHMAIALHHAHRIQAQKDTEALILDRILDLVSFPASTTADPSSPSPEDTRAFKDALIPFQPADYDNLIQERNIEGRCGYGLCPREHRKDDRGGGGGGGPGTFRIRYGAKGSGPGGRGREMNIVPKEKWEMWCSDECAERAMYIRVQLAEEPVWERRGDTGSGRDNRDLVLLEEGRGLLLQQQRRRQQDKGKATVGQVTDQLGGLHMHENLALERGDSSSSAFLQNGRVDVHVKEKDDVSQAGVAPPRLRPGDSQGGSVEGYFPKPE